MKRIALINNKGGVGKTTLSYHLAHMFAHLGYRVLAADLDPQANLTSLFLGEEELEKIWPEHAQHQSIYGALEKLSKGRGDIDLIDPVEISTGSAAGALYLLPGDLALSGFEDTFSGDWASALGGDERAWVFLTSPQRLLHQLGDQHEIDIIIMDVGPNLGAINRVVITGADNLVVPVAPDLFSLQGLRNLGPTLQRWRKGWVQRLDSGNPPADLTIFPGKMNPLGYVILQHSTRNNRVVKAYKRWAEKIPATYRQEMLAKPDASPVSPFDEDPYCLGTVKNYASLLPMAMEANKPVFALTAADGAIGSHISNVQHARNTFKELALRIDQHAASLGPGHQAA